MRRYITSIVASLAFAGWLALASTQVLAQPNSPQRVIKSFHLGPWAPPSSDDDVADCSAKESDERPEISRDTVVVTENGQKFYNPPPCQYCIQCNYQHWCPYCGYCPLYDESDIVDEYDRHASWPSKRSDSWMREFNY